MSRRKPKVTLPSGSSGEFVLTPAISRLTDTRVGDLEKLVQKRAEKLGLDLHMRLTVVNNGMKLTWGVVGEDDLVIEEMTDADGNRINPENEETITDDLWGYLNDKFDELNPNKDGEIPTHVGDEIDDLVKAQPSPDHTVSHETYMLEVERAEQAAYQTQKLVTEFLGDNASDQQEIENPNKEETDA